jgi:FkbM family methyltransferase
MIQALRHGWREGLQASALTDDACSRSQLRRDFFWSRLLKLGRLPGYNRARQVQLGGLTVNYRFNRGDLQSLREVLVEEVYACDLPFVPQTVLDLGANIGLASLWLARRVKPSQTQSNQAPFLLAVEPVPENAAVAEANFRDNGIPGEVVRAAVGQRTGEAWFETRTESNLGRLAGERLGETGLRVAVIGIRDLLARFPGGQVDLMKMDIEGGEEELLGRDIDWLARVRALIVEWHDDRADSRALIQNVVAAGFDHQRINSARQHNLSLLLRAQP